MLVILQGGVNLIRLCLLFLGILFGVSTVAALLAVFLLPDGNPAYLAEPKTLIWYLWSKRAGLKIQILFVSAVMFFMVADRGVWR